MTELRPMYLVDETGALRAYVPLMGSTTPQGEYEFEAPQVPHTGLVDATGELLAAQYTTGDYIPMSVMGADDYYRSPTLVTPHDYYTRARWSVEYYEQEAIVNAFIDRDIAQAMKPVEFQLPEDKQAGAIKALKKWSKELNQGIGHRGGLAEYNRKLALGIILKGMTVTLANWGPVSVDGEYFTMPKVLVNLDPLSIVPDFDPLTGQRIFYFKLSPGQADSIRDGTATGFLQIIPDAAARIIDNVEFLVRKLRGVEYDPTFIGSGPFLKLPTDELYSIYFNEMDNQRWPMPSLTPIFSAIAMKRKLNLSDFSTADGMINMLMIWKFPIGTKPTDAKKVIDKFILGGRVQSHSVPAGVELEIVTPPTDVLNSSEKFWQPMSEIYMHFNYPLNSKSRGAGDLDSGPLDMATNQARLNVIRDYIVGHNDFYLALIAKKNKWDFEVTGLLPRVDMANTDAFRAFAQGVFDRGKMSHETYLDLAGTTLERELARIKREKEMDVDDIMEIRPTFSQTTATSTDGRPPEGGGVPSGARDKQTRNSKDRPSSSSQGNTTKES